MKKLLVFILAMCLYLCVLTACGGDEIYLADDASQALTSESDTKAQESNSESKLGDDNEEAKAEQTFGGMKELQPLN